MNNIALNQNTTNIPSLGLVPTSLNEVMQFASIIAKSSIIPKEYHNKPGDIVGAILMGTELGLKPMQALLGISVINGKPSVYGDVAIALVQASPLCEYIEEHYDKDLKGYICTVKRKNHKAHTVTFTEEDAKKAGLWGKPGPWQTYPKRMLQMRARGFALRDKFADLLEGLITAEEAQDYPVDVTSKAPVPTQETKPSPTKRAWNTKLPITQDIPEPEEEGQESSPEGTADNNISESETVEFTAPETEVKICEKTNKRLAELVKEYHIPDKTIYLWCQAAEIETLDQIDKKKADALINQIEKKYTNNKDRIQ